MAQSHSPSASPSPPQQDPADREKALADQLRRRAMASKNPKNTASSSPPAPRRRGDRSSRSPPSRSSQSPPPRSTRRYDTDSPDPEPAAASKSSRRSDRGDRERERHRRRSGRDSADPDSDRRRSNGHDSHRRASVARSTRDEDDDDDARSQRSSRRYDSRERDRDPYDRRRQPSSRRHDYEYDYYRGPPPPRGGYDYYSPRSDYHRGGRYSSRPRSPSPPRRRTPTPEPDDYERRSVFCSQLSARLTQRDLGEFFEEKLGEDTVKDVRIVTDRHTGRSKGIGYVELRSEDLVRKACDCSGEKIYGIPILVQLTEAARNRGEGASTAAAPIRPNLIAQLAPGALENLPLPPHLATAMGHVAPGHRNATYHANTDARLYVGSLHFSITDADLKAVFEPFGEIDHVDLHREPNGKSKGFAFVQFKRAAEAERAIEHMDNFELAGRNIRVGHVNARGQEGKTAAQLRNASAGGAASPPAPASAQAASSSAAAAQAAMLAAGNTATLTSAYDDGGGGGLTSQNRANLMAMLARNDGSQASPAAAPEQVRPASIPEAKSRGVLLKNMFNPEEETERDWDKDLAEDVKGECESKYGRVEQCLVDKDSSYGEIYLRFADIDGASRAIAGLNGRWFGGRQVGAVFISEGILSARLG
ncbi:splicing factor, CC1-like protein [Jaminaea rosea]|uniref:Splicing factor, CC1-like protein n=1 Tax=Jaminaea rosea TaxID=1569628 RepID=A0A316UU70_9BASI|nr:splicing factor, CC1-like protein [Jaminaea rosea]PWN27453.1 splicing factor, CC1-like protein [Jaminaea rosea]